MTSFVCEKDSVLETYTRPFEAAMIEESSLEDILMPTVTFLNNEITRAKSNLESCRKEDEAVAQMTEMLKGADLMQTHFEFTLAMLDTTSEEEMSALKEKYSSIRESYEIIKTKEDLTVIPAKHVVAILHTSIVLELSTVLKRCFRKRWNGKFEVVKNEENSAWMAVMTERLDFFVCHYPPALTLPKDDIFCQPKSSPVWEELSKHVTFKKILTEAQVRAGFEPLFAKVNLLRILFKNFVDYKDLSIPRAAYSHLRDLLYYVLQPAKAKAKALLHLVKPKVEEAIQPWRFADHPITNIYMSLGYPSVGHDELIYIPRLFPAITKEVILNEYKQDTLNKIQPMDMSKLMVSELPTDKSEMLADLFVEKENKIPIRILAPEYIEFRSGQKGLLRRIWDNTFGRVRRGEDQPMQSQENEQAIVINIHGGGFVALSSNTQKVYLNRWVNNLNLVHFSIDYRLAPENMYPDALDDVWQSYLWIINYAKTVLGIENQKVILTGDSAGGTLALALSLRLIKAGMQPPHGIVLVYPALNIDDNNTTPSQFLALNDGMLPVSLVKLVANAYAGEEFKKESDPFLSPIHASDELLEKLPPLRMLVGSHDPLADDHWRLLAKLRKLEKNAKLVVHENLPHGYLGHQDCVDYDCFVQDTSDAIQELLAL